MDDPRGRRYHAEIGKGLLPPAQELEPLAIPLELDVHVPLECTGRPGLVHLDGMVDHQVHRDERVDASRIAPQPLHRRAHRGQVHHGGYAGEILEEHPRGHERHLDIHRRRRPPPRQTANIVFRDQLPIDGVQDPLQEDLDGEWQAIQPRNDPALFQGLEPKDRDAALPRR